MTVIRTSVIALTVAVVVALLTGRASNKGPAEAALAAAQSAVDSVMAEASKYDRRVRSGNERRDLGDGGDDFRDPRWRHSVGCTDGHAGNSARLHHH